MHAPEELAGSSVSMGSLHSLLTPLLQQDHEPALHYVYGKYYLLDWTLDSGLDSNAGKAL